MYCGGCGEKIEEGELYFKVVLCRDRVEKADGAGFHRLACLVVFLAKMSPKFIKNVDLLIPKEKSK